ncbi:MAG: hypothetical protein IPM60_00150 [Rhodospirillales bacterium]|nr:hypothetical protein [Rhodospirillales bacterium]
MSPPWPTVNLLLPAATGDGVTKAQYRVGEDVQHGRPCGTVRVQNP